MPRTRSKAKQTRLTFATAPSSTTDVEQNSKDGVDRQANLRYSHPSLATLQKSRSKVDMSISSAPTKSSEEKAPPEPEKSRRKRSRKKKREKPIPAPVSESDDKKTKNDSESDVPVPSSGRKERKERDTKRKRSPTPSNESDDDEIMSRPRRKLRRGAAPPTTIVLDNSSEEEDLVLSSPAKKRRLFKNNDVPQTPRRGSDQDRMDLEEDLEDLQDSVVKKSRTRGRLANSTQAKRQQHLDALRRRRAGDKKLTDDDNNEPSESESGDDESGSEEESVAEQVHFHNERNESDVESSVASNEDLDRYDDDFVLEDDDDKLGAPTDHQEMPFEFSRHAYKQLKDYFQDAVEWMVHNKLNPAFPRDSQLYKFAFSRLEDEVRGRTGSQLLSSVWNTGFRRALLARPQIEITAYPIIDNHPCDACNRSGHPASFDMKFYGKAYSLDTLEPLTDDSSNEDNERSETEDDDQERDRDGYTLPDEGTRFYLGRHCKTKAEMAHTLTHWRFHLNEWVTDHIERMGCLSDEEVLARSHWSQKRKGKYATEIVSTMIANDEVKKLWRDFHISLRTARESTTFG
ncbi:hypothetical protein FE257_006989 [Aspergillus nanangensis]|uniref:DUF4211 domain-containing protein n=1 Tax=Aspergillus nanangensis TaxID=2582783 RepID=A0AAD4CQ03_ASPNN|nr:hypothetical protein FE257_006989 [Aspergillus nanangensis]